MLFNTNPVTINDGTTDHVFTFRAQLNDKRYTVGEWVEPAADTSLESKLVTKHDTNSATVRRRLLQRKVMATTADRGLRPITINYTVTYDVQHAKSDLLDAIGLHNGALNATDVKDNLLAGMI